MNKDHIEKKTQKVSISNYNGIFIDITNEKGSWLSTEDEMFYKLQMETNEKAGYLISKIVPTHPSKCIKDKETVFTKTQHQIEISDCDSSKAEIEIDDDYAPSTSNICSPKRIRKLQLLQLFL